MNTPLLSLLAALLLQPAARADKFWFESPDAKDRVEGSLPAVVEGVLLGEQDGQYWIRVVGGEIRVPKALVVKIESDSLTVAAIEAQEHMAAQAAAERAALAQEARARREAAAAEAVARRSEAAPAPETPTFAEGVAPVRVFDPVIGALRTAQPISDYDLMRDLELAYSMTGDRSYVKLLRKMRRLR